MRRTFVVVAMIPLVFAIPAQAQVRVGRDSTTRLMRFGRDAAYGVAEGLGFAAYDQWQHDPPEWGDGSNGYGKRAASNVGEFLIQEGVTEGVAAIMQRPLDYTRCTCHTTAGRIGHALQATYTDELANGTHPVAIPRILGAYAGSFAQASWRPSQGHDRARVALANGTTSLALGALINLYHEFK